MVHRSTEGRNYNGSDRQTELRGWQAGGLLEQQTDDSRTTGQLGNRSARFSGYDSPASFRSGFNKGTGRVTYQESGAYISTYDDRRTGKGRKIGRILTAEETTDYKYVEIRNRFRSQRDVVDVLFLDGKYYDSATNTLNDGGVLTFPNGAKVVIIQANLNDTPKMVYRSTDFKSFEI